MKSIDLDISLCTRLTCLCSVYWVLPSRTRSLVCPVTEEERKEMYLFNGALNIFHLRLYGVGQMVEHNSAHSAMDGPIEETHCRHMGYSFRLAARVLLYAPSHRQDSTYHRLCYTSRGALAGTRNVEVSSET